MRRTGAIIFHLLTVTSLAAPVAGAIPAQQSAPNRILRRVPTTAPTTVPMPTSTATPAQSRTLSRPALLPQTITSMPRTATPSQGGPTVRQPTPTPRSQPEIRSRIAVSPTPDAVRQRPPVVMRAPVRMPIDQESDVSRQNIEVPLLSFVGMRGASQSSTVQTINVPLLSFTGNRGTASAPAATQLITVPALTFVGMRGAALGDTSTLIQTPPLSFTGVRP